MAPPPLTTSRRGLEVDAAFLGGEQSLSRDHAVAKAQQHVVDQLHLMAGADIPAMHDDWNRILLRLGLEGAPQSAEHPFSRAKDKEVSGVDESLLARAICMASYVKLPPAIWDVTSSGGRHYFVANAAPPAQLHDAISSGPIS